MTTENKHLWHVVAPTEELVQSAASLSKRLEKTAADITRIPQENEPDPSEIITLLHTLSDRMERQQMQLESLILNLSESCTEDRLLTLMIQCGIDRHELVSCWGIDKKAAIKAEETASNMKGDSL